MNFDIFKKYLRKPNLVIKNKCILKKLKLKESKTNIKRYNN